VSKDPKVTEALEFIERQQSTKRIPLEERV
jgi:hypothetical protein